MQAVAAQTVKPMKRLLRKICDIFARFSVVRRIHRVVTEFCRRIGAFGGRTLSRAAVAA
jgi:hypothetical protein